MPPGPARWGEVVRFCEVQGYRQTRTDHLRFLKPLPDGTTSGTMVSNSMLSKHAAGDVIEPEMWRRVWQKQLRLANEGEFWTGLSGAPVRYAMPAVEEPPQPLPRYLERFLRHTLHWTDDQIAATGRETAQDLLNAHYSAALRRPGQPPT